MALNVDIDNVTLDIISTRLKNVVSPLDILKWLANFEKSEVNIAIDIASNMTVFTTFEIEEVLNACISEIYKSIEQNERLVIHPVGEFGKSGSMIAYFFQKIAFYKRYHNRIILAPDLVNFKCLPKFQYHLILLDDFVGSGNTVIQHLAAINDELHKFDVVRFIGIAGMETGVEKITPYFNEVLIPSSNVFKKAFSSKSSIFGYRKYDGPRELSFKYGQRLTSPKKKKDGSDKYSDALGYENSQALVSFSYGSPNNTLPIIWCNKNGWQPLIPRFSVDKISAARDIRKNISYELSILKEFGSENIKDNFFSLQIKKGSKVFSSVDRIDFSIYAIIKLSRAGFLPINICQKLGLSDKDYEECLTKGKERGIFEKGNKLTLFGLELFRDAKKCIERKRKNLEFESKDIFAIRNINYLPKKFNGKS